MDVLHISLFPLTLLLKYKIAWLENLTLLVEKRI